MKVVYREAARDDIIRQFRYYLQTLGLPSVAVRFRESVKESVYRIAREPLIAPLSKLSGPDMDGIRSWPVTGFESIRIYLTVENDTMQVIRILHGKRNIREILEDRR